MSIKLSIVVPAYNEENYIEDCLQSIFKQAGDYVTQIIVVNNASTDRTREIVEQYPNITIIDEPRKGLTYARQAGFEAATGDIVANVDADSRLPEGWIYRVIVAFRADSKLICLSGPLVYYDLTPTQCRGVTFFYLIGYMAYFINRYILRIGSMVQGGNFVVRRKALESIGGFDTSIAFYGEDADVARRMYTLGKVAFDRKLKMFSSARRLKGEGMLTMAWKYSINYFWTIFFDKPFTEEYVDIRN